MRSKTSKAPKDVIRVTESSRNVFGDLGLPNPEQELLKAQLTLQIYGILKHSGMTQVQIAKILGVRQPQVSLLCVTGQGTFRSGG